MVVGSASGSASGGASASASGSASTGTSEEEKKRNAFGGEWREAELLRVRMCGFWTCASSYSCRAFALATIAIHTRDACTFEGAGKKWEF